MSRFFMKLLAVAFPWIVLLIRDNPGGAIVALIMQTTLIGWIPASMWALRTLKESEQGSEKPKKSKRKPAEKK